MTNIDREPGLDLDALAELASALEPFAKVASLFKNRKPQNGDIIHAWEFTSGSAELRVSDCERAAVALATIDMARRAVVPSEKTEPVAVKALSASDPRAIIAGIRQFGLAADGSDLRDLEAALDLGEPK